MSRSPAPWILVAGLALVQAGLSWAAWSRARGSGITYVFTPLLEVVPGGTPLGAIEAEALMTDARHQVDARDVQRAYGRLGSTLSLDELLRGVETLDAQGRLSGAQRERIRAVLDGAAADHARMIEVQERILDLEARIGTGVASVHALLPDEIRAHVAGGRQ
ncbi:MAG: hypothetical protein JXB39_14655 [Deltaproteobacteria bacterium]|nr:hypothetical protein [Deltaproteobacteria bacterium]